MGTRVLLLAVLSKHYAGFFGRKHRLRSKPLTKTAKRGLGRRLRYTLAPLLANNADAIEARRPKQQRFLTVLRKPICSSEQPRGDVKAKS